MLTKIQRMFALSRQGAKDLIKGCIACILQNLSLMVPVSLLYILVSDLMGGEVPSEHLALYIHPRLRGLSGADPAHHVVSV